jgi:two-component system, chemotaxis family, protein-glutamate methylesterase/glutaminase
VIPSGLIILGGSAGSIASLLAVAGSLSHDLTAAVLVVVHTSPDRSGALPDLLSRAGALAARFPEDGERLAAGRILVAPPDHHLLIRDGSVALSRGPRENRHRPSIDATFRSAAVAWRDRVAAVVLSGALGDGAAGLRLIVQAGGFAIVQDPAEALFPSMPEHALAAADAEVLPTARIPGELLRVAAGWSATQESRPGSSQSPEEQPQQAAAFGCPECGGVLSERPDGSGYQCRVGHGYSVQDLVDAQREAIEAAIWSAIRGLEETAELNRRLAGRDSSGRLAERFRERALEATEHADTLRRLLLGSAAPGGTGAPAIPDAAP